MRRNNMNQGTRGIRINMPVVSTRELDGRVSHSQAYSEQRDEEGEQKKKGGWGGVCWFLVCSPG